MITCHDHQLVEIVRGGSRGNSPAVREGLQVREAILGIHAAGPAGINYTKHVNAHVYLGVWRITLKQRPSRCGEPHDHADEPFAWHTFVIPRFGKSKSDLANRDII